MPASNTLTVGRHMFPNLTDDTVLNLAAKAAFRVAREYPGLDADDLMSEALARLAEKADRLECDDEPYIYTVLYNDATRYAAKERYDYMMSTCTFLYRPKEVRALLSEAFFDPAMWDVPSAKDDRLSAEISGRTVGVSLFDIQEAWKKLKPAHKDLLLRRFRDGEMVEDRKAVTRAVDALTRYMNGRVNTQTADDEGPGTRKVISNDMAQYMTRTESGHEHATYRKDAVSELDALYRKQGGSPAGTHFDWDRHTG